MKGLSLNDVTVLGLDYGPAMTALFKLVQDQDRLSPDTIGVVAKHAAEKFPTIIGVIIGLATGMNSKSDIADANAMSMGVQVQFLEAVFNATFRSESDIVKMIESLSKMLEKVSTAMETVPVMGSDTGTGTVGGK